MVAVRGCVSLTAAFLFLPFAWFLPWGAGWWGCIFFAVWGVVGCVFAGVGAGGVGDVFWGCCCRVVLSGVVTLHPKTCIPSFWCGTIFI